MKTSATQSDDDTFSLAAQCVASGWFWHKVQDVTVTL